MERCLWLYNAETGGFSAQVLDGDDLLPTLDRLAVPFSAFVGRSKSEVVWSDRRALLALDRLYTFSGIPFCVDAAFCDVRPDLPPRLAETGTVFMLGRDLSAYRRRELFFAAIESGEFRRVLMPYASGNGVTVSYFAKFRMPERGETGTQVLVMQKRRLLSGRNGAMTGRWS